MKTCYGPQSEITGFLSFCVQESRGGGTRDAPSKTSRILSLRAIGNHSFFRSGSSDAKSEITAFFKNCFSGQISSITGFLLPTLSGHESEVTAFLVSAASESRSEITGILAPRLPGAQSVITCFLPDPVPDEASAITGFLAQAGAKTPDFPGFFEYRFLSRIGLQALCRLRRCFAACPVTGNGAGIIFLPLHRSRKNRADPVPVKHAGTVVHAGFNRILANSAKIPLFGILAFN